MSDLSFCQAELEALRDRWRREQHGAGSSLSRVHTKELEHKPSMNALIVEAAAPEGDTSSEITETLLHLPRNIACTL